MVRRRLPQARRLPGPPKALIALLALLATPACVVLRGGRLGTLEERHFIVERGNAIDADVRVAFFGGDLHIAPAAADAAETLVRLDAKDNLDDMEPRCDERRDGNHVGVKVFVDTDRAMISYGNDKTVNEWYLELGTRLPLALEIAAVTADADFELGGIPLTSARLKLGAGDYRVEFSRENPITMDRLELEMGAGQVEVRGLGNARCHSIALSAAAGKFIVDCSGEWKESTSLHVDAGMCDVEIHVPADLAVRVDATEAIFAGMSFPDFREMRDGIYESPACRDREPQLLILLDTNFGGIQLLRD